MYILPLYRSWILFISSVVEDLKSNFRNNSTFYFEWILPLLDILINICARHDSHQVHSVFDTHLFVFVIEEIQIGICIQDYPCSNPNPIKNMKTNTMSTVSASLGANPNQRLLAGAAAGSRARMRLTSSAPRGPP